MPSAKFRAPSRVVGGLSLANFVLLAAVAVIFPLLPDLQDAHGLSTGEIGAISAMAFGAGLVAQLALARFVDRGYARPMLVAAALVCAAGLFWLALAETLWQFMGARFLVGLGYALFGPAARAVAAADDPTRVGANLGTLSAGELAGVVVGPVLGSVLAGWLGLDAPFWILGVVSVFLAGSLLRVDTSHLDAARAEQEHRATVTIRSVLAKPAARRAALLQLALYLPVGTYDVLWARYLTDLGAGSLFVGLSFTIYGVPYVAVALFGARAVDRFGPVRSAWWSLVALVPVVGCYGLLGRPGLLVALSVPEAFANAVGAPAAQAAMADACDPHELGTGQGIGGAMGIGAAGLAAVSMAPVYEHWGGGAAFGITALAMGVVGVMAMTSGAWRGRARPSVAPSPGPQLSGVTSVSTDF
jgi:MFS family permease